MVLKCPILYINLDITIQLAYIVNNHVELYNGFRFLGNLFVFLFEFFL